MGSKEGLLFSWNLLAHKNPKDALPVPEFPVFAVWLAKIVDFAIT